MACVRPRGHRARRAASWIVLHTIGDERAKTTYRRLQSLPTSQTHHYQLANSHVDLDFGFPANRTVKAWLPAKHQVQNAFGRILFA